MTIGSAGMAMALKLDMVRQLRPHADHLDLLPLAEYVQIISGNKSLLCHICHLNNNKYHNKSSSIMIRISTTKLIMMKLLPQIPYMTTITEILAMTETV